MEPSKTTNSYETSKNVNLADDETEIAAGVKQLTSIAGTTN